MGLRVLANTFRIGDGRGPHARALVSADAGTDRHIIVYRRSDGAIGWVDPAATDGRASAP
ncbi:MAG: hypothetical protein JWM36_2006 [Hyphomicrobiales bacterium]|nr:hypothetical protein [Hyphomicrobiales bacterium]MDB5595045.1 hypothetical protein [Hyphomicrobiales bacterium]